MNNPTLYSINGSLPVEKEKLPENHRNLSEQELLSLGYEIKNWPPSIGPEELLVWTGSNWLVINNPDYVSPPAPTVILPPVPPEN